MNIETGGKRMKRAISSSSEDESDMEEKTKLIQSKIDHFLGPDQTRAAQRQTQAQTMEVTEEHVPSNSSSLVAAHTNEELDEGNDEEKKVKKPRGRPKGSTNTNQTNTGVKRTYNRAAKQEDFQKFTQFFMEKFESMEEKLTGMKTKKEQSMDESDSLKDGCSPSTPSTPAAAVAGLLKTANRSTASSSKPKRVSRYTIPNSAEDIDDIVDTQQSAIQFYKRKAFDVNYGESVDKNQDTLARMIERGANFFEQYLHQTRTRVKEEELEKLDAKKERQPSLDYRKHEHKIQRAIEREYVQPDFAMHLGSCHLMSYNHGQKNFNIGKLFARKYHPKTRKKLDCGGYTDLYSIEIPLSSMYSLRQALDALIVHCEDIMISENPNKQPDLSRKIPSYAGATGEKSTTVELEYSDDDDDM